MCVGCGWGWADILAFGSYTGLYLDMMETTLQLLRICTGIKFCVFVCVCVCVCVCVLSIFCFICPYMGSKWQDLYFTLKIAGFQLAAAVGIVVAAVSMRVPEREMGK